MIKENVNMLCYTPKNKFELEGLVGRTVMTKIKNGGLPFETVYYGLINDKYLFVRQSKTHGNMNSRRIITVPSNIIVNYQCLPEYIRFSDEGVVLPELDKIHTVKGIFFTYASPSKYEERMKLETLRSNCLWENAN